MSERPGLYLRYIVPVVYSQRGNYRYIVLPAVIIVPERENAKEIPTGIARTIESSPRSPHPLVAVVKRDAAVDRPLCFGVPPKALRYYYVSEGIELRTRLCSRKYSVLLPYPLHRNEEDNKFFGDRFDIVRAKCHEYRGADGDEPANVEVIDSFEWRGDGETDRGGYVLIDSSDARLVDLYGTNDQSAESRASEESKEIS